MSWLWLDLVERTPADASSVVPVTDAGSGDDAGALALWECDRLRRPARALRADSRMLRADPERVAAGTWVSWCRLEGQQSLAFDDGAVCAAIRRCLERPWPGFVSTLLVDWSRIAGAVTVASTPEAAEDDPFARVFPRRLLRLAEATFAAVPAPTGPCITRYGSGNPWPWDRYSGQEP